MVSSLIAKLDGPGRQVLQSRSSLANGDAKAEITQAQARLEHDLERYRTFLLKRCEQESCRPS